MFVFLPSTSSRPDSHAGGDDHFSRAKLHFFITTGQLRSVLSKMGLGESSNRLGNLPDASEFENFAFDMKNIEDMLGRREAVIFGDGKDSVGVGGNGAGGRVNAVGIRGQNMGSKQREWERMIRKERRKRLKRESRDLGASSPSLHTSSPTSSEYADSFRFNISWHGKMKKGSISKLNPTTSATNTLTSTVTNDTPVTFYADITDITDNTDNTDNTASNLGMRKVQSSIQLSALR